MEIRQLRAEEFEDRMAISQFAFQVQLSVHQLEEQRGSFAPEQEWGVYDDQGSLISALSLIPFECWVQGKLLRMGGIAGVATWPEARRQGCVSKLLVQALKVMREQGQTISMLHPFSFPFYHKYGWEMTIERKKYTLAAHQLPSRAVTAGHVKRIPVPDIDQLHAIYSSYAARYNGMLRREPDWWKRKILSKPGIIAIYTSESGEAEGYVGYEVTNRKLIIHDMAALTEVSRQALWTYIANHDSMLDEVILIAPLDDALPFLLPDPRIKQEIIPYFMSRIVDASSFLRQYAWEPSEQEDELTITLSDAYAPWNNGVFGLKWSKEGTLQVEDAAGGMEQSSQTDLTCDIQALAAMLLGNRKPSWLHEIGRLEGSDRAIDCLERRIPVRSTYLMDFF